MTNILCGIDPGSSSSPTALALLSEAEDKTISIIGTHAVHSCGFASRPTNRRIMANTLFEILKEYPAAKITIENPMLQGSARELLYALMAIIENYIKVDKKVAPCSVKKFMGHGTLEKEQMAQNLLNLSFDRKGKNYIKWLIEQKRFDETDAICIALYKPANDEPEESE